MPIELRPLCDLDIALSEPLVVGDGALGTRLIYGIESGTFTGERLRGSVLGGAAGDWVLLHGMVAALDVRLTLQTDDGALVLAGYRGRTDLAEGVIRVAPTFETGDERYAWLNAVQAVGTGTLDGTQLRYEWHEVR